ncbi:MAG: TlpA family protein disulfide reductase [Anaerolineae bacterium]|nr:TlpA family protein disulfide reductase [Anaerolineae bacterium]
MPYRTFAGVLFALSLLALTACRAESDSVVRTTPRAIGVQVGDIAPDLALQDLAGETVRLGDYRGQAVLINFWAVWCTFCRIELPEMQAVYDAYRERGFVILAIDVQDAAPEVQAYADELGLAFPILLDPKAEVTRSYRVRGLPTSCFLDQDGVIIGRELGPIDEAWLERHLAQVGVQ